MNILVAVDLSSSSQIVVNHAKKLVEAFSGKIWLLHIASPDKGFGGYQGDPRVMRDEIASQLSEEHRKLQQFSKQLHSYSIDCSALLVQGSTVEKILSEINRLKADMVVLGSHGKSATRRFLMGSISEGVLRESPIPVLIIPTHSNS